jgi:CBS domain-containing protein
MLCEHLMKQMVECVSPGDPVKLAAQRMRGGNIGFLPVCDDERHVLGTLTDRDIAMRVVAEDKPTDIPVEQIMTREVVACRPSDSVTKARRVMGENQKSRLLCTDEDGHLVGVISLSDLAEIEPAGAVRTLREVALREVRV